MQKRGKLVILVVSISLVLCFFGSCYRSPKTMDEGEDQQYYLYEMNLGCAEIQSDGTPRWEAAYRWAKIDVLWDEEFMEQLLALQTCPTNDTLTNVELIQVLSCGQPQKHILYLAYDYSLEKVYLNKDGSWRKTNIPNELNTLLIQAVDCFFLIFSLFSLLENAFIEPHLERSTLVYKGGI